jgi:hypothetical protein
MAAQEKHFDADGRAQNHGVFRKERSILLSHHADDKTFRISLGVHFEVTNDVNCNWAILIRIKYIFINQINFLLTVLKL